MLESYEKGLTTRSQMVCRHSSPSPFPPQALGVLLDSWYSCSLLYRRFHLPRHLCSHGNSPLARRHQRLYLYHVRLPLRPW